MLAKLNDRNDWYQLWFDDKQSIIETMMGNLKSDVSCGSIEIGGLSYNSQMVLIEEYSEEFKNEVKRLSELPDSQANRWCYSDLAMRGVIG